LYENNAKLSLLLTIVELLRLFLRGRRPVRADPRLRTDENHIRAQSRISEKSQPKPHLLLSITAFSVRMLFIRTENAVGARSAQVFRNSP
jgi:hypothetical protein